MVLSEKWQYCRIFIFSFQFDLMTWHLGHGVRLRDLEKVVHWPRKIRKCELPDWFQEPLLQPLPTHEDLVPYKDSVTCHHHMLINPVGHPHFSFLSTLLLKETYLRCASQIPCSLATGWTS